MAKLDSEGWSLTDSQPISRIYLQDISSNEMVIFLQQALKSNYERFPTVMDRARALAICAAARRRTRPNCADLEQQLLLSSFQHV